MTNFQHTKLNMILSVVKFLNKNSTIINSNSVAMATAVLIKQNINELQEVLVVQMQNSKGIAKDKNAKRKTLEKNALQLSAAICAFANVIENTVLFKDNYLTKSVLQNASGYKLTGICSYLVLSLEHHLPSLLAFGVTEASILEFKNAIDAFTESINKPAEGRTTKRESTQAIPKLLAKITALLNGRMDYNMMFFEVEHPSIVATYLNLRRQGKTPRRQLDLIVQTISGSNQQPIEKAKLKILNKKGIRYSSKKGRNTFMHLKAGQHQLTVTHPNYQPKTLNFSVVDGETTKIVVELLVNAANASDVAID